MTQAWLHGPEYPAQGLVEQLAAPACAGLLRLGERGHRGRVELELGPLHRERC
jgi:hypothetical protein